MVIELSGLDFETLRGMAFACRQSALCNRPNEAELTRRIINTADLIDSEIHDRFGVLPNDFGIYEPTTLYEIAFKHSADKTGSILESNLTLSEANELLAHYANQWENLDGKVLLKLGSGVTFTCVDYDMFAWMITIA